MNNGTPIGKRIHYKITRGSYRVVEWRGSSWHQIARDISYQRARELCKA